MRNQDVAHKFFYDRNGSFERASMTTSYEYNKFYSYSTCIGEITKDINGDDICIISRNNFSSTTSKHLSELRCACPMNMVYLPQGMGRYEFTAIDVFRALKGNLEYYSKEKLTQKANREGLTDNFEMLQDCLRLQKFESLFDDVRKVLDEYRELYNTINSPEKLKDLKEKLAKIEREKQAQLKKELDTLLNTHSYTDLIKFAYSDFSFDDVTADNYEMIKTQKSKLRKYFNPKNELSFIWADGDYIKTSQHVSVDRKESTVLLKLWLNNKLKHGMKISYYTVLQVMDKFVKIGCHKIPVENLRALASELRLIGV